jgi:hypothetical protein
MKADVYRSSRHDILLFLPEGQPFSALPQCVLDELQSLQFYKRMELEPNMEGANSATIEADFDIHGYSVYRTDDYFGKLKLGQVLKRICQVDGLSGSSGKFVLFIASAGMT